MQSSAIFHEALYQATNGSITNRGDPKKTQSEDPIVHYGFTFIHLLIYMVWSRTILYWKKYTYPMANGNFYCETRWLIPNHV